MKNWKLTSLVLVVLVSLFWVFWPEDGRGDGIDSSGEGKRSRTISNREPSRGLIFWKRRQEEAEFFEKHGVPVITPEQLDQYLAEQDYSAEAYVAAYHVSRKVDFLKEGLRRHPESGFLLFTICSLFPEDTKSSPEERLDWVERLLKVEPDNIFAALMKANLQIKSGWSADVLASFQKATELSSFREFSKETHQEIRDLYEGMGATPEQASIGILGPKMALTSDVFNRMNRFGKELEGVFPGLNEEDAQCVHQSIFYLGIALMEFEEPQTMKSQIVGMRLVKIAMEIDSQSSSLADLGIEVVEAEASITAHRDDIERVVEAEVDLGSATMEMLHEYLGRVWEEGEMSAAQWLQEKISPEKNQGDTE